MSGLLQDVRYGLRVLRRQPTFTAVAVLTLALGIGINAAMFSVVNAVLLRPLPFTDPGRLVAVHEGVPSLGFSKIAFAIPDLMLYEQGQKSFQGMAAYRNDNLELSGIGEPTRITAARVTASLFPLLGVQPIVRQTWVLGDYLRTMGIPLIRGRLFTPEDREGTQPVTVVSEDMAKTLWPEQDPIGKRILRGGADGQWLTVVGVVGDVADGPMSSVPRPHSYSPYLQERDAAIAAADTLRSLQLAVRSRGNPDTVAAGVIDRLHRLDPALAISNVRTMQTEVKQSIAPQRFNAMLVGIYAGLALILALIGIYGVLAYMVMQQTHEMGIRMALGAQRRQIVALVVIGGMRLVLAGAAIGLVGGAWAVTRLMQGLLYGVTPGDPITFLAVTALLSGAALLACYIPALRAARIDPMAALRYE